MKFKIGDRVRIVLTESIDFGKEASVIGVYQNARTQLGVKPLVYQVEVDGIGRIDPDNGYPIGFEPQDLEPIVNPDETAWTEFKRYLQPDPAVILSKEPA